MPKNGVLGAFRVFLVKNSCGTQKVKKMAHFLPKSGSLFNTHNMSHSDIIQFFQGPLHALNTRIDRIYLRRRLVSIAPIITKNMDIFIISPGQWDRTSSNYNELCLLTTLLVAIDCVLIRNNIKEIKCMKSKIYIDFC